MAEDSGGNIDISHGVYRHNPANIYRHCSKRSSSNSIISSSSTSSSSGGGSSRSSSTSSSIEKSSSSGSYVTIQDSSIDTSQDFTSSVEIFNGNTNHDAEDSPTHDASVRNHDKDDPLNDSTSEPVTPRAPVERDSGADVFGVHLEVTSWLLTAEQRKLEVLQKELIQELQLNGQNTTYRKKEVEHLKTSIYRIQQQHDQLEREYKRAGLLALRYKRSSRSQPAIGLKPNPKSRPSIFGTITKDVSPIQDKRRSVVSPQMLSLQHMFDIASKGYEQRRQITNQNEALVFQDGNLVAGSLDALIQHLVPTTQYYPERTYIFTFLLSSRLFIAPYRLLHNVCQVCMVQQSLAHESVKRDSLGKFGPNVIQMLSEWTELFPYDFRDDRMMKQLRDITHRILNIYPELKSDVTNLTQNLINRLSSLQRYEEILSKLNAEAVTKSQSNLVPTTDIVEVCNTAPLDLAQQLTHIELERLSQIGPEEFVQAFHNEKSNKETTFRDMKKTSNLEAYVQWFNRLSYLIATEICTHLKKRNRVRMIEFFIDVAKECINIGNFNSLMAVIAGLNMSPVARLKKTWAKVNTDKLDILEHQMDPSANFGSYRSSLKTAMWRSQGAVEDREKIIVPFFSLFVKDLYFLNEGCPNKNSEGYINFQKLWQLGKQISEFITWQQVGCPFEKNGEILHYILTSPVLGENTLALASFECEAPESSSDKERHKDLKAQAGL